MKLLVATDGSDQATDALAYATDIAAATDGSITVVHAVEPDVREVAASGPITDFSDAERRLFLESVEDAEERGLDILEDAAELAEDLGHVVETELLYGDTVTAVTRFAEDEGFDTIYVGHQGRSDRTDMLVGSVAKDMVGRSNVPVTVVR